MARKPKLDTILAEAVDTARLALSEIAEDSEIGEYCGAAVEGERLVTHRFVSHRDGYRGWTWFVTLARISRAKAKDSTVCELGIIPGEDALLAPAWVPWADRLAQEEIDAAQDDEDQVSTGETETGEATQPSDTLDHPAAADTVPEQPEAGAESTSVEAQSPQAPENTRRPVRRRRTAQRTAARRRAAARNRGRKTTD